MCAWEKVRLGEVCQKIGSGATPTGGANAYKDSGISLIRSQNVLDFGFSYDGLAFIDEVQASKLSNVKVFSEDILLNITGDSVARACRVPFATLPARVNQHVAILRTKQDKLDNQYLLYLLQFKKLELLMLASAGATRKALTKKMLEDFEICLPPLEEQKHIAAILSSIDDKIENNNAINRNLEEQAQALYKNYFENDIQNVELGKVIKTTSGGTPTRSKLEYYENGTIPWIKSKELNSSFIIETEEKITTLGLQKSSAKILPKHSIVLAMYGATVAEYAIIASEMTSNQAICALIENDSYSYAYIFMFLKNNKEDIRNMATGSAQQNISQEIIKKLLVSSDVKKITKFSADINPLFSLIETNIYENVNLIKLRDSLLPKLMSGEIHV